MYILGNGYPPVVRILGFRCPRVQLSEDLYPSIRVRTGVLYCLGLGLGLVLMLRYIWLLRERSEWTSVVVCRITLHLRLWMNPLTTDVAIGYILYIL